MPLTAQLIAARMEIILGVHGEAGPAATTTTMSVAMLEIITPTMATDNQVAV